MESKEGIQPLPRSTSDAVGGGRSDKKRVSVNMLHTSDVARSRRMSLLSRGVTYRVGNVDFHVSHHGQHFFIRTFQTLLLLSIASIVVLFFQALSFDESLGFSYKRYYVKAYEVVT